jgi:hypothetical protein
MGLKRLKLIMLLAGLLAAACEPPAERQRVNELRKVASETPVYPGFEKLAVVEGMKSNVAVVNTRYASGAAFEEVKEFYMRELIPRGWELREGSVVERGPVWAMEFRKGLYSVTIQHFDDIYLVSHNWNYH